MGVLARLLAAGLRVFPLVAGAIWFGLTEIFSPEHIAFVWDWYRADMWHNTLVIIAWVLTIWTLWEVSLAALRTWYQLRWAKQLVCLKVTQPRQETHKDREEAVEKDFREKIAAMEQLYRSLHEIGEMNMWNTIRSAIFQTDLVSFEMLCEDGKVNFYVIANKYYIDIVEKQLTSFYTDAYVEPVKELPEPAPKGMAARCYYFYQKNVNWRPFKTYKSVESDPLNSLTNVMSKLQPTDRASIQLVIRPTKSGWQKQARRELNNEIQKKKKGFSIPGLGWLISLFKVMVLGRDDAISEMGTNQPGAEHGDAFTQRDQATDENLKHCGEKISQPGFCTMIRIVAASQTEAEAEQITNGLATSFGMYKSEFLNWLQNRRIFFIDSINDWWMLFNYRNRLPVQGVWPLAEQECLLVAEELASIYHLPTSRYNFTPIIEWLKYKIIPPPTDLPDPNEKGNLKIGISKYRGEEKMISMKPEDRLRHFYLIGKSGSGKSALISYMARQDIANGDGVCVVDPHGDLVEDILNYIPKERAKDVIVFDPGDIERPMGLNLLEANTPEEKDFASLAAMEIFIKLFGNEIFGPRLQHYFRNGCLTLMDDEDEGATIIDVPRLFTDDEFSKYKVSKVKNPVVRSFWEREMAKTGQREKEEMIPYFSAKFGAFVTNTMMRNIIGQKKSAFDFRKIMDEKKILLVNLSKGKIGDINAQLLGLIFVNKMNMAAMGRVDVPEDQRPNFWLYVDEFQNFATDTFATILSEARKYHLGLTIAHQYIGQLTHPMGSESKGEDPTIRDAVFGNVGTMMNFKIGASDAEYMAKEYAPLLSEQDVINIANYSAYMKLNVDNTTSRPFSIKTIWDETGKNPDLAALVKNYSRLKYGRKKDFVDAEVSARIGIDMSAFEGGNEHVGGMTSPVDGEQNPPNPPLQKGGGEPQASGGISHPLLDSSKAFTPLPAELDTVPEHGAKPEKVTAEHVAVVEESRASKTAA